MSRQDVIKVLAMLTAAYNRDLPKETAQVYVEMLADLEPGPLTTAATECVALSRFFPTVAELREGTLLCALGKMLPPSPYEAWQEITEAASRLGRSRRPSWSHPAVGAALDTIGGYRRVCDSQLVGVERSHFLKAYEALVAEQRREVLLASREPLDSGKPLDRALPEGDK